VQALVNYRIAIATPSATAESLDQNEPAVAPPDRSRAGPLAGGAAEPCVTTAATSRAIAAAATVLAILAYRWWSGSAGEGDGYVTARVAGRRDRADGRRNRHGELVRPVQVGTYVSGPILIDVDNRP
jgi:hypothetical protein